MAMAAPPACWCCRVGEPDAAAVETSPLPDLRDGTQDSRKRERGQQHIVKTQCGFYHNAGSREATEALQTSGEFTGLGTKPPLLPPVLSGSADWLLVRLAAKTAGEPVMRVGENSALFSPPAPA
jgi:hypothetical protein